MIVQKDFLNKVKQFGLNSYEAKIWTALLSRGISTAGELSDISNVPRSRSYDVLESLEKKGFIIMKLGKPIKYIAVPPAEVIERVKKRIMEDAEQKTSMMENIRESNILNELNNLHNKGVELVEPTDLSGSIKGRGNLYNQMETMIKAAEKSIVIMTTAEGLQRKADALKSPLEKAKKRGIKIRIASQITKDSEKAAAMLSKSAQVKHIDDIKARFCLVDGKEISFMLMDEKVDASYDTAVWVNTPFFAGAFQSMFDNVWKTADVKVFN